MNHDISSFKLNIKYLLYLIVEIKSMTKEQY